MYVPGKQTCHTFVLYRVDICETLNNVKMSVAKGAENTKCQSVSEKGYSRGVSFLRREFGYCLGQNAAVWCDPREA